MPNNNKNLRGIYHLLQRWLRSHRIKDGDNAGEQISDSVTCWNDGIMVENVKMNDAAIAYERELACVLINGNKC